MAASTETATNGNGNDYSFSAALKLHSIGEKLENLQTMEDAIYLVNTYGRDFPSEVKGNLDIYTYRVLRSQQGQHQNPASNIHHYYHTEQEGLTLFSMVNEMHDIIKSITQQQENNSQQQQSKDIDINKQSATKQQGDSTVKQNTA